MIAVRARPAGPSREARLWIGSLLVAMLAIGLIAKSFVFVEREPVLVHYALTGGLVGLAGLIYATKPELNRASTGLLALLVFAVFWSVCAAVTSGIWLNYVSAATFALLVAGYFYIFPALAWYLRVEPWHMVGWVLGAAVAVSAIMLVITPDLATDRVSGRFSGALISVAVACNVFFLATVLALRAALSSRRPTGFFAWGFISALSLILLYMTKTRSSLLECLVCMLMMLAFAPLDRGKKLISMAVAGLMLAMVAISGAALSTGIVAIDQQLDSFRLADRQLTDARGENWRFGMERIAASPYVGEGLLAKQTQGGSRGVDFDAETSYDPRYDPHSLALSFGVQAGIPFLLAMLSAIALVFARFLKAFGLRRAFESPEFVICSVSVVVMMLAGGDLTALGNTSDRLIWILLGTMAFKAELVLGQQAQDRRWRQPLSGWRPHRPVPLPARS